MGCGRSNVSDAHVTDGNASDMTSPRYKNQISSPPGDVRMPHETAVYFNPNYPIHPDGSLSNSLFTKYNKNHINELIVSTFQIEDAPIDDVGELAPDENSESVSEAIIPSIDEESVAEIKPARRNELELSKKSLAGSLSVPQIKSMKTVSSRGNIKTSLGGKQKFDDILQMKDEAMRSIMTGSSVSLLSTKPIDNVVRGKFKLPPLNSTYRNNAFDGRNRYQELQDMMEKFNMSLHAKEPSESRREDTQELIDNLVKEVVNLYIMLNIYLPPLTQHLNLLLCITFSWTSDSIEDSLILSQSLALSPLSIISPAISSNRSITFRSSLALTS
jgi:hypothetical protein